MEKFKERSANTYERLADCIFYGGMASGKDMTPDRFEDAVEWYKNAGDNYKPIGMKRVMELKRAITLMFAGGDKLNEGKTLLDKVIAEEAKNALTEPGNLLRFRLLCKLAVAVFELKKIDGETNAENDAPSQRVKSRAPLYELLKEFPYLRNPTPKISKIEAGRRENLEIWLFAAELLLDDLLRHDQWDQAEKDHHYLAYALDFLPDNQPKDFTQRFKDLSARIAQRNYEGIENP